MVARHYYRFVPEDPVAEVPTVLRWDQTFQEKAEEGEAPMIEVVVDDPDMELDFVGHRRWVIYEDDSDDDNEVIYSGLTQAVKIAHKGGDITNPGGRVWMIEIADLNTLWTYRVMTGSDSQFPEQTDVERMQQLVDSEEMGYFDDLSLLSSASPVTMDKANHRGQTPAQVADTCAQESGKNWYIYSTGSIAGGSDVGVWYGKDSLTAYESPISLSNDPADLDWPAINAGTATTYPIGADTVLRRDYARQYSGAYGEFAKGAAYVVDTATRDVITLGGRDMVYPAPEITSRSRMKARLARILDDHATPDEVISTTIYLPGRKLSQVRAGMRIPFKATHEPGYEDFAALRIMSAQPRPVGRKGAYDWYTVALELQGPGPSVTVATCSTSVAGGEDHVSTGTGTSVSDTITPSVTSTVLAFLLGMNSNTPSATDMTAITGYTDLFDIADAHNATYRIASKAVTGGDSATAAATFTGGFAGKDVFIATQVAFPATLTLVQQKNVSTVGTAQTTTFDSTPTTGNLIVMFCHAEVSNVGTITPGGGGTPADGWTLVGADTTTKYPGEPNSEWVRTAVYARCMAEGDGSAYGFTGEGNSNSAWIAEFEVS